MKIFFKKLSLSCLFMVLILSSLNLQAAEKSPSQIMACSQSQCDLRLLQQKLWINHVTWTRSFIVSDLSTLQDKDLVLQRLLKNQDHIGDAFKPYYGTEVGNKLAALLREHIEIAGQVVNAAKTNNSSDLEKYNKLWYQNADQIADFLASINPYYERNELKEMLYKHLELLTEQTLAILNKDWQADIDAYDEGEVHMIMFADRLADGIIKQFPEKFR